MLVLIFAVLFIWFLFYCLDSITRDLNKMTESMKKFRDSEKTHTQVRK